MLGEHVVLLAAAAKAVSQVVLRMPLIKLGFNVAQWAACAGCGALTFAVLTRTGHSQPALLAAMVVVAGTNLAAVVGLFGVLDGGAAVRQLLRPQALQWSATVTLLTTTTGLGITAAAVGHSTALLFVVALPVLLHLAGRGYPLARADLDRIRRLQAGTRAPSAVHDVRLEATPFLTELAHSCQALGAELALRRHDGEGFDAFRYRASSRQESASPTAEASLTKTVLAEPLPLHAVGQSGPAAGRQRPRGRSAPGCCGRPCRRTGPGPGARAAHRRCAPAQQPAGRRRGRTQARRRHRPRAAATARTAGR
jgi:hypothetical protein